MDNLISIIVPVYNVEKYLPKCINSILSQTYNNFELILIDDGSPDKCGLICDKFAESDNRIKVIHQKNSGVSTARNNGLKIAQGDFITFIDSDDYVAENYLQYMLEILLNNTDTDFIICNFLRVNEHGELAGKPPVIGNETKVTVCDNLDYYTYGNGLIWGALYRKQALIKNGKYIRFEPKFKNSEDNLFSLCVTLNSRKFIRTYEILYYYLVRDDSAFHAEFNKNKLSVIDAKWQMIKMSQKFKVLNDYIKSLFLTDIIYYMEKALSCNGITKSDIRHLQLYMFKMLWYMFFSTKDFAFKRYYILLTFFPYLTYNRTNKNKE